jgi:hypothetical protein
MPFPFIDITVVDTVATTWETPKEFAWDFENRKFIISNGCIPIVEGQDALKIWIYKCLFTVRGRFNAYTWDFGTDIEFLVTSGFTREAIASEAKRMIREAVKVNSHIKDAIDFDIDFYDNVMKINFVAVTDCGDINIKI